MLDPVSTQLRRGSALFRIFTSLVARSRSESSARCDRTNRRPTRVRVGLDSLEDRQVLTTLIAAVTVVAYFPNSPIMPAALSHWAG